LSEMHLENSTYNSFHAKVSELEISLRRYNRSKNELKEFSRKCETDILSRVIRLEQELGSQPDLLDLLCRFNHAEIDTVWCSLLWLYPNIKFSTSTDVVRKAQTMMT